MSTDATSGQRKVLAGILIAAALLRVAWGLYGLRAVPITWVTSGDQYSYWYYADQMARGHGYISYTVHRATSYYPIGYPALLAGLFIVLRHTPLPDNPVRAVALLHAAMGTATVGFVYLLGRHVGTVVTGLVGAGLTAVFPNLVFEVATFSLETAFVFFALLALTIAVTTDWWRGPPSPPRLVAFGLVLGASALVRPFSLPFLAGLILAMALVRCGWRLIVFSAGIVALAIVVVLTPWTLRNATRMHAFVPFSTNLGDTLCLDRSLSSNGGFSFADHEGCAAPDLGEVERNASNTRLAAHFVTRHPDVEARLVGQRFVKMMRQDHSGLEEAELGGRGRFLSSSWRRRLDEIADGWFFASLALAVPGIVLLARGWRRRPERAIVFVALATLFVIPLGLWGNPRFHVPLLPLLAIVAAMTLEAACTAVL